MNLIRRRGGSETLPNDLSASWLPGVFALSLFIVLLIAFLLRFHSLGVQSFWNDEGSSYVQATRSFTDIAANAARDIHPPGYYWLLAIWRVFTGDSEFALRSLSAFASLLTVAFTYALGKRLYSPLAGLFAALFVALNTFSIYYAQEARMYALLALWAVMSMWLLAGMLSPPPNPLPITWRGGIRWALPFALVNAAGLYTQYAYPFVMLAQAAIFLVWLVTHLRSAHWWRITVVYIAANLLTVLLYLPWLPTALHQVTNWPNTGQAIPTGEALRIIGGWFIFGITFDASPSTQRGIPQIVFVCCVMLIGWLFTNCRGKFWHKILPMFWFVVPVGLFIGFDLFRPANIKFLLPAQIGFALFMGAGLTRWWRGFRIWDYLMLDFRNRMTSDDFSKYIATLLTGVLIISIASPVMLIYVSSKYQRPDYRSMVAHITADLRPGDAVILDAPNQEEVFRYYYRGDTPVYPLPPGLGGNDNETELGVHDVMNTSDRIFVLFWGEAERDPNHMVERVLDSETYPLGNDVWYGDVRLAAYSVGKGQPEFFSSGATFGESITLENYGLSTTLLRGGDALQMVFVWRTTDPQSVAYKVFVQLLNPDGGVVVQRDSEPSDGLFPTYAWEVNSAYTDRHGLIIPPDLPPGTYTLITGMYNRDNPSARLPVNGGDYLVLGQITIRD